MKKYEIFERHFVVFFAGFSLAMIFVIPLSFVNDEITEKKLNDQEAIIEDQQNMINSYVNILKKKCPDKECDCGWLQDFYDEFHEEVGAYE